MQEMGDKIIVYVSLQLIRLQESVDIKCLPNFIFLNHSGTVCERNSSWGVPTGGINTLSKNCFGV